MNSRDAKLFAYTASAGSGKTYQITRHVMDVLIAAPDDYSKILAVTFTNKATAEVKERIVKDLALVAYDTDPKKDKERNDIIDKQISLRKKNGGVSLSKEQIIKQCQNALWNILLDFDNLSVSTIDSFEQRVIRAFAYEHGLNADYRIEIEKKQIAKDGYDLLMEDIKKDDQLRAWMLDYVDSAVDNGKYRQVKKSIIDQAVKILGEVSIKLTETRDIRSIKDKWDKEISDTENKIVNALSGISQNVDPKCFSGNSTLGKVLKNNSVDYKDWLAKLTDYAFHTGVNIFTKSCPQETKDLVNTVLTDSIKPILSRLYTVKVLRQMVYEIGILAVMQKCMMRAQSNSNVMAISTTGELLNKLIGDDDAPFIYEKIGSRYKTIMIDEFQDTNSEQYHNFLPLLRNSIANNNDCFIVGDVKQSIYRFRGGDWTLLHKIVANDFGQQFNKIALDTNYRSCRAVVSFNNALFRLLPTKISENLSAADQQEVKTIYDNCAQKISKSDPLGYVSVKILNSIKDSGGNDIATNDSKLCNDIIAQDYAQTVLDVCSRGYQPRDICFLIKRNAEAEDIVTTLASVGINSISEESLKVLSSATTQCITDILKYMVEPRTSALPAIVSYLYQSDASTDDNGLASLVNDWDDKINETHDAIMKWCGLSLIDLNEHIIDFLIEKVGRDRVARDNVYIDALSEHIREFVKSEGSDVVKFLELLAEKESEWCIELPESQNVVRIMTIHKSKGLEFPVVIIPALASKGNKSSEKWVTLPDSIQKELSSLPSNSDNGQWLISQKKDNLIECTDFAQAAEEENKMSIVDELNTIYVALTRPKFELYVWVNNANKNQSFIAGVFKDSLNALSDEEPANADEAKIVPVSSSVKDPSSDLTSDWTEVTVGNKTQHKASASSPANNQLPLRLRDSGCRSLKTPNVNRSRIVLDEIADKGTALHNIMQYILTRDDIDKAISLAVRRGEIDDAEAKNLAAHLAIGMNKPLTAHWFDGTFKVLCEMPVISENGNMRIDRFMADYANRSAVVLDYKFGSRGQMSKHKKQVSLYMDTLRDSGLFDDVHGFLWYVLDDTIVDV
ncbi:MAG: UvrD-helicase domain-containing protein [Bacteroidales bacterium]|nr:UvrD-helicase domain-containing protein [Bacteroidales bacterium]